MAQLCLLRCPLQRVQTQGLSFKLSSLEALLLEGALWRQLSEMDSVLLVVCHVSFETRIGSSSTTSKELRCLFAFALIAYRRVQRAFLEFSDFLTVPGASLASICTGDRAVVESRDRVQDAPPEGTVVALGGAISSQHVSNSHE